MKFAGVDPGKAGALALLDERGRVLALLATPMIAGANGRADYDLVGIAAILRAWSNASREDRDLFVTIEKLGPMPGKFRRKGSAEEIDGGGTIANFNRGVAQGWAWMLAAFRIPYQLVRAQEWQRTLLVGMPGGDTKTQSIAAARSVWPGVELRRSRFSRSDDDGKADALWLAEYGRRTRLGGAIFAAAAR